MNCAIIRELKSGGFRALQNAGMAELADAQDLGSCEAIRVGSTPTTRTKAPWNLVILGAFSMNPELFTMNCSGLFNFIHPPVPPQMLKAIGEWM